MTREDLQRLADVRLSEAGALFEAGYPEGAYYLAGYAAECAIKACIAKQTDLHEFPDLDRAKESWSHDLARLIKAAGFQDELVAAVIQDTRFDANWKIVRNWRPESRYRLVSQNEAAELLKALREPAKGVMEWLKLHW
ncbi:MAG: HEPN domain-containing protein [Acidobacteriota bacterium]